MPVLSRLDRPAGDRLQLVGTDALDLLHRLAATSLRDLAWGQTRRAVFCDDRGRVIDVPLVLRPAPPSFSHPGADAGDNPEHALVEMVASYGRGPELRSWLERWIITEDVRLDRADTGRLCSVHGDLGDLRALGVHPFGGRVQSSGTGSWVAAAPEEDFAFVWTAGGTPEEKIVAAIEPLEPETMRATLLRRGAWIDQPAGASTVNALELGLRRWIDFDKGCYIGQEVIARLDTYDKVRRRPAVLHFEGDVALRPGGDLRHGERRAGRVLDAARDAHGQVWALAVVDRELESGTELTTATEKAGKIVLFPAPFASPADGSPGPVTPSSGPTPS